MSSSASSMATFSFSTMAPPQGATFVFGSWVWVTNGLGCFDSHLANPATLEAILSESCNKLAGSDDHGVMLPPDLAKEIELKLEGNSGSTRTQIDLKPKSTRIGIRTISADTGHWSTSTSTSKAVSSLLLNRRRAGCSAPAAPAVLPAPSLCRPFR